jgi:hypothetical protein
VSDSLASPPLSIIMAAVTHYVIGLALVPLGVVVATYGLVFFGVFTTGLGFLTVLSGRDLLRRRRLLAMIVYGLLAAVSVIVAIQFAQPVFLALLVVPLVDLILLGTPPGRSWFRAGDQQRARGLDGPL